MLKMEEPDLLHQNRSGIMINISDLNFCGDCCDDLNDTELKQVIESRLDLNYFNNVEALKKRETDIYKDIKTCVRQRPLISCVDLCLCESEACIYQHINRARTLVKALNCMKRELRIQPQWKDKEITMSELEKNNLGLERCWLNLSRDEVRLVKLKLVEKSKEDQLLSDQSFEQNSVEQPTVQASNNASPIITSNSLELKRSSLQELIIITFISFVTIFHHLI